VCGVWSEKWMTNILSSSLLPLSSLCVEIWSTISPLQKLECSKKTILRLTFCPFWRRLKMTNSSAIWITVPWALYGASFFVLLCLSPPSLWLCVCYFIRYSISFSNIFTGMREREGEEWGEVLVSHLASIFSDDEPCPKELFPRPKIRHALEYLDLLRSTLPQEKYTTFLTLMLDVKEQRSLSSLLFASLLSSPSFHSPSFENCSLFSSNFVLSHFFWLSNSRFFSMILSLTRTLKRTKQKECGWGHNLSVTAS
jgi:hypothetical protein